MARRNRRKTFWIGASGLSELAAPGTALETLIEMDDIEDRTATLVRVVGTAFVRAARSDLTGSTTSFNTEGAEVGLGLMCVEGLNDFPGAIGAELTDERWMWTDKHEVHAVGHPNTYWKSNTNEAITEWFAVHSAPYPPVSRFDVRAMRKFEEPCILAGIFTWDNINGLAEMDTVHVKWNIRALFKAS